MTSKHQKTRILLLSANPRGTSKLRLDEEMREIKEGLRRSRQREQYEIDTAEAVRYRDIHRAILDYEPNIVHFSGHGAGEEGLVFEDETGHAKLVDAEALAGLFELFADQVECVILNACYSKVQAQAIAQHISYVIGMSQAIGDRAAIEFAVGFYDALGAGRPVEFAHRLGCNLIRVAGIPENLTPQLLTKNHAAPRPPVRSKPPVEQSSSRTVTPYPSPPSTPPPESEQEVKPSTQPPSGIHSSKVARRSVLLGSTVLALIFSAFLFNPSQQPTPTPGETDVSRKKIKILHASVNNNNEFSSRYDALKTVDSYFKTYWSTKGGEILDVFMEFFFHEPKSVSGFKIYAPIEKNNYAPPEKYTQPKIVELIFFNDSEEEITRKQIKLDTPSKQLEKHDFEQINNVSKVKLKMKELTKKTAIYLTIHELEFYGY